MKKSKKIFLAVSGCCLTLFLALWSVNRALSKPDYAEQYFTAEGDMIPYVLLNDSERYCFLPFYSFKHKEDLTIRSGKNMFLSKLRSPYGAYSADPDRNFLVNHEGAFGFEVAGFYVKERVLDDFFQPTPENISHVEISGKSQDHEVLLSFRAEDAELFDLFLKTYSDELADYSYPNYVEDSDVFNEEYRIDVFYQNDEISRFLRCIDQEKFQALYAMRRQ